jgi:hypothetical protein
MSKSVAIWLALVALATGSCGGGRRASDSVVVQSAVLSGNVAAVKLLTPCVTKTGATEWWASFGYESASAQPVGVAIGATNTFTPTPADRGQPTRFDPGLHARAFSVQFNGSALTWKVGTLTVTASSTSPVCPSTTNATTPVLGQFVLYAQTDIRLDRTTVIGGDVGVVGVHQMTDGRDEVSLEPNGRVDPTHGVFGKTVDLRSGAVMGTIYTTRLDNQGGTFKATAPFPSNLPAIPALAAVQPGTTPVTVASGVTTTLQPGAYGAVQVTGTLTLAGGTYVFQSLDIWTNGRVEAANGARVRIKGHLYLSSNAKLRTNPVGLARDLLVEVGGGDSNTAVMTDSQTEVHALITAPTGQLVFHPFTNARGAFVAREILVNADAKVVYESGFPPPTSICLSQYQLTNDQFVTGQDPNTLPRLIATQGCFMPDASTCQVSLVATANFDMRTAAKQMIASLFTPSQYIWISRDRTRKLRLAEADPTWVAAYCKGDADGDLVPDDRDNCPSTPSLTATDDHGCTDPNLPAGPSAAGVKDGLTNAGVLISQTCDGAATPTPPIVTDVCLDRPNLRYLISVPKVGGQPPKCALYYEMMTHAVEQFEARETVTARLAFEKSQAVSETATTYTFALPLTCTPGHEDPGDGKSWPCDEANGDAFDTVIGVRATNGNGQQSQWGPGRRTLFHLCP